MSRGTKVACWFWATCIATAFWYGVEDLRHSKETTVHINFDPQTTMDSLGDAASWLGQGWHPAAIYIGWAYAMGLLMLRRWVPKMRQEREAHLNKMAKENPCGYSYKDDRLIRDRYDDFRPEAVMLPAMFAASPLLVPLRLLYLAMTARREPKLSGTVEIDMNVVTSGRRYSATSLPISEWVGDRPKVGKFTPMTKQAEMPEQGGDPSRTMHDCGESPPKQSEVSPLFITKAERDQLVILWADRGYENEHGGMIFCKEEREQLAMLWKEYQEGLKLNPQGYVWDHGDNAKLEALWAWHQMYHRPEQAMRPGMTPEPGSVPPWPATPAKPTTSPAGRPLTEEEIILLNRYWAEQSVKSEPATREAKARQLGDALDKLKHWQAVHGKESGK